MIKIYTLPDCVWCKKTKEFLKNKNKEYKEYNVKENKEALKEMKEFTDGSTKVPVINIDGKIIQGYEPEKIEKLL